MILWIGSVYLLERLEGYEVGPNIWGLLIQVLLG